MLPATIRALCVERRWSALILYRTAEGWGRCPRQALADGANKTEPQYHTPRCLCACLALTDVWHPARETHTLTHRCCGSLAKALCHRKPQWTSHTLSHPPKLQLAVTPTPASHLAERRPLPTALPPPTSCQLLSRPESTGSEYTGSSQGPCWHWGQGGGHVSVTWSLPQLPGIEH